MSFQLKTVLGIALIEAVLLFLLVLSSNAALSSSLERELEKRADTTLELLRATWRQDIIARADARLEEAARKLATESDDVTFVTIREVGRDPRPPIEAGSPATRNGDEDVLRRSTVVQIPSRPDTVIELELSRANALAASDDLQRQNTLIAASEMLLVALFSFLLGRYLTRELKKLQQATAAIASGELGVVIPVNGGDELAGVARSFNRMSQELLRSHVQQLASEAKLSAVLDGLQDGVCLLDSRNRVRYRNPQATRYLETLTPSWRPDLPLTHLDSHALDDLRAAEDGRALLELEREDAQRWFEVHIFEETSGQRGSGEWILTCRDVTAARARDDHDRRQEQLAVVGQLAAGLAHDFNNILGVIIGVAELNLMNEDELAGQLRADFQTIHEQAQRSSQLIRQILDFSRGGEADTQSLHVGDALHAMVDLLQRTLPSSIELTCEVEENGDAPLEVPFDETKFQQVIANLVINAAAAMPSGGAVQVTARSCEGQGLRPNAPADRFERWVVVTVADSGEGIPRKNLQRIFEPFFTTKDKSKGAGLGLAQVYGILQRQGGDIHVDSTVGKGTCFSLFLRVEDDAESIAAAAPKEPRAVEPADGDATVLLVEDQDEMRATVAQMLRRIGYEVLEACSGEQGLERFDAHRDSLAAVLTDAVMPGIDGLEMAAELRRRGCDVPIVLMSGYFERQRSGASQPDSGLDAFLPKPVGLKDLSAVLGRLLTLRDDPQGP
ncbi:MAG: ATP-binding protein [Planctomycetota bacterium]